MRSRRIIFAEALPRSCRARAAARARCPPARGQRRPDEAALELLARRLEGATARGDAALREVSAAAPTAPIAAAPGRRGRPAQAIDVLQLAHVAGPVVAGERGQRVGATASRGESDPGRRVAPRSARPAAGCRRRARAAAARRSGRRRAGRAGRRGTARPRPRRRAGGWSRRRRGRRPAGAGSRRRGGPRRPAARAAAWPARAPTAPPPRRERACRRPPPRTVPRAPPTAPVNAPRAWPNSSALEQVVGQRRAVDGAEPAVASRAEPVDRARDELLAACRSRLRRARGTAPAPPARRHRGARRRPRCRPAGPATIRSPPAAGPGARARAAPPTARPPAGSARRAPDRSRPRRASGHRGRR